MSKREKENLRQADLVRVLRALKATGHTKAHIEADFLLGTVKVTIGDHHAQPADMLDSWVHGDAAKN
jgi:hypothetical protein